MATLSRSWFRSVAQQFVPFDELVKELRGTMLSDDRLERELRELDEFPRDPFA
jgi:hypothetical protein